MSKSDKEFTLDAIGTIVGFVLFTLISVLMVYWSDNKDHYYSVHPDFVPGTVIFISILVLFPLMIYSGILITRGLFVLMEELIGRYAQPTKSPENY